MAGPESTSPAVTVSAIAASAWSSVLKPGVRPSLFVVEH